MKEFVQHAVMPSRAELDKIAKTQDKQTKEAYASFKRKAYPNIMKGMTNKPISTSD